MTTKDRGEWRNLHSKGNKIPKVLKASLEQSKEVMLVFPWIL